MSTELGPHNLTSDTSSPPFVVSTVYSYTPGWQAFDGDLGTFWLEATGSPWTLEIDLGTPQVLGSYAMAIEFAGALSSGRTPSAWEMQGSNDGSSWTALDTQTGITWPSSETQTFTLATVSAARRYYRLHITASNGDATYCGISELYLYQGTATIVGTTPQTITFPPIPDRLITDTRSFVLVGSSDSGLPLSYAVTSGLATISGSTITITGSGSITLTATQAGSGTYAAAAPVSQTFAVIPELGPHDLTSDTSHPPFVVSTAGPTYSPEWQAFDGNLDTYWLGQSGSPWTLEIDLGTPQVLGSYAMAIEFAGALSSGRTPSAWEMQGSNDGSSWTALDTQTGITWPSNETQTFTLATASAACRYYRLHITASNGDATYCGISELYLYQGTATIVGTTPQTITFPPVLAQTTGALVTLGAASDSGLAVNYSVTGPATISGSSLTLTGAGTVTVIASQAGNATYATAATVSQSFTVTSASLTPQTVTFPSISAHLSTDAPFALAATSDSGLAVSYAVTSGPATVTGNTVTLTGAAGSVTIQATQAGNGTYAAATPVSRTFAVGAGAVLTPQTITFPLISNGSANDPPFALIGTASSGLPLAYAVTSGLATISGNVVTITGVGTVTIQATQAGNGAYAAATPVSQSFTVAPAQRGCIAYDQIKASDRTGNGNQLLTYSHAPASATSPGTPGQVAFDAAGNWYFCYGVNQWGRIGPTGYGSAAASPPSW